VDVVIAKKAIVCIRELMEKNKDFLVELDSMMGDGDLGLTMVGAFRAADEKMKSSEESDIGRFFAGVGMEITKAAPSTMGTLVATGFMRGGRSLMGKSELFPADMTLFFRSFVEGLMDRGKSKPGDKSVIDVIDPAVKAMEKADDDWNALADAGIAAARSGLENSSAMMARHGRAAYYKEKSIGKQDPGGTAGLFIVEGMLKTFKSEKSGI